jgi:cell cycle sensor histidine kinase DivJ
LLTVAAVALAAALIAIIRGQTRLGEAAMTQRVAEISHDLRTPLTHILGFAEMIEKELFGPAGARNVEYAGLIRQSGVHLLDIVNDLLDLSKIEAGRFEIERERFDARAIVDEVVRLSADAAERKRIALSTDARGAPIPVNADPRALRRMLMNTVGNAIKFTPEGGRVTIEARASDGKLVLDTIDTGPGIPEAERARLGAAYERGVSGRHAEGTGLGLALVRALAALHGGILSFHDAPGGGALVRIEMPVIAR